MAPTSDNTSVRLKAPLVLVEARPTYAPAPTRLRNATQGLGQHQEIDLCCASFFSAAITTSVLKRQEHDRARSPVTEGACEYT